jgi:hypothetical protein
MNKSILEHLYKIYKIEKDWDGSKVLMNANSGSFFSTAENRYYKVDCNTNASYYFYNMHREKSGAVQVEVYKRDFEHYSCPSSSSSSSSWGGSRNNKQYNGGFFDGDIYQLVNRYVFSVELTEETLKYIDVGVFSSSEITSPERINECKKIFMKGLEEYGMKIESVGGNNRKSRIRNFKKRDSKIRKSNKKRIN